MSLQDNLNAEAEFIGSVIAELEAERVKPVRETKEQKRVRLIDERNQRIDSMMAEIHQNYLDRRDDITTPETTYGFPPATLSW